MEGRVAATHSRFGGLWIDRADWQDELARREQRRAVSAKDAALLRDFVRDGFIILPQAAPPGAVDAFQREIESAFRNGRPELLYQSHKDRTTRPLAGPVDRLGSRVVDSYVALPQALDLFTSPALMKFLALIFDAPPLLFQSLSFDQGSQQGLHQDTAYVVVDQPLELAACWIALQDVRAGSGELIYLPGSHRYPDYDFGRGKKHWSGEAADQDVHVAWSAWIHEEGRRRGLAQQSFLARKGDILVWHADLAHGGAQVEDASLTRQSLVGHFCPAVRRPHYFDHGPRRSLVRQYGGLSYASEHYDLGRVPAVADWARAGWVKRLLGRA
jgi:hypothetical protein